MTSTSAHPSSASATGHDAGRGRNGAGDRPQMKVIIWGINYFPEPTGIAPYTTDLARHLHAEGMSVAVVTGFAYYPAWRTAPADRRGLYRRDLDGGISVHRCRHHVPARPGSLGRMLHEASFILTSMLRVLTLPRADLYVVVSPPLGIGLAAWLVTRLKRSRYLFHVQDLQPDTAAGLGMMQPGPMLRVLYACERFIYRGASGVSGIAAGMMSAFAAKGVPAAKTFLLPNWRRTANDEAAPADDAACFRHDHGIPADALLAVYSGNLGRKQGLGVLLDAAAELAGVDRSARPIVMVIAGDGAGRPDLERRLAERPLANVRLLPLQSAGRYVAMLSAADVALITQLPGTGQFCFPSKLLSVLAAGLPVIAVADDTSDLAHAVREGGFGCQVAATDAPAIAAVLHRLAAEPGWLELWAARTNWVGRFAPELMLPRFAAVLRGLAGAESGATLVPVPVAQPFNP